MSLIILVTVVVVLLLPDAASKAQVIRAPTIVDAPVVNAELTPVGISHPTSNPQRTKATLIMTKENRFIRNLH
jgi:hypothetical protein